MATDFYVDALKVEKVIYPVLPDSVQVNDEITVTAAKFNDNTTTKVKYSVNGGTYINLGTIKESCTIRATDFGKIDIVVEINIEGAIITLRQTVFVISDPATEDIEWN